MKHFTIGLVTILLSPLTLTITAALLLVDLIKALGRYIESTQKEKK